MNRIRFLVSLMGLFASGPMTVPAAEDTPDTQYWVEAMKKVHARFTGTNGTFAQFGDSISFTMAFWSPLAWVSPPIKYAAGIGVWALVCAYFLLAGRGAAVEETHAT